MDKCEGDSSEFGEAVCVWIKLRDEEQASAEEMRAFCRARIAHYKVSKYVGFVAESPLTVTGKTQKLVMRQKLMEQLDLQEQRTA